MRRSLRCFHHLMLDYFSELYMGLSLKNHLEATAGKECSSKAIMVKKNAVGAPLNTSQFPVNSKVWL